MANRHRAAGLAIALLPAALAACGDDDRGEPSAAASEQTSGSFCEAALAWFTPPDPENHEFDQAWFDSVLRPRFDRLRTTAPAALDQHVDAVAAALDGGDEADGQDANERIHDHAATDCRWSRHRLTADEYTFRDAPTTVPAGIVTFEVVNDGDEAHMVKIVRRNDDVTLPFAEIVTLPEDRQDELVEGFEPEAFIEAGDDGFIVADLPAGDYALVCELTVGTATTDDVEATDAPTHAVEGMVHEFTVK